MTHLYLIRHAQQFGARDDNEPVLGEREDGLTQKGHAQAHCVAAHVANQIQPDVLYSSPLLRARQTARHISEATGLPINIDSHLAELRLNCPAEATPALEFDGWVRARRFPYTPAFAGGEALADLYRRGVRAIESIAQTHAGKTAVVITHGGLIEMALCYLQGIPIERNSVSFVRVSHTGIFHWHWLEIPNIDLTGWELVSANDTHHLDGLA